VDKPLFPNHQFDELSKWDMDYIARNHNWENYEWWAVDWRTSDLRGMRWKTRKRFSPHQIVIMYLVYFILNEAE